MSEEKEWKSGDGIKKFFDETSGEKEVVLCWSCEKREPMKGHGQCCSCRDNQ
jgi:hypothetical protein